MENAALTTKVERNSTDIHLLTVQVVELATMMKNSEKRYEAGQDGIKAMAEGIDRLNEKFSGIMSLSKDVVLLKEMLGEIKGDVRVNKHDITNLQQSTEALKIFQGKLEAFAERITASETRLGVLETRAIEMKGGATVIRFLWATFGSIFLLFVGYLFVQFVEAKFIDRVTSTTTTETQRGP